ncbi:MAG: cytochrome c oxidase subunit 3 [Betaproteobacteria bacterium]|nr:cytochrome c oxidase subunit 3 [Betaproteobacteria bacterium]
MAQHQTAHGATPAYFIPQPAPWPIIGSVGLFSMALGAVFIFNAIAAGWPLLALGAMVILYMMFRWFGDVIRESEGNLYSKRVDMSFRWSMSWFIFSEVMFFAAFFGALFWTRVVSVPDLGSLLHAETLWPGFKAEWPSAGPGATEKFTQMGAWGLPALNTFLLLSSGVTITVAHWALKEQKRGLLNLFMFFTVALGAIFLVCQVIEYGHGYSDLNLKLTTGVYGSTFYMLTGFHGFHVTIGTIMLIVILARCLAGHFKPDQHFAFEAVAWYWHFVDVVWLGLFVFVYWL